MLSRRELIGKTAVGAAAALTVSAAGLRVASARSVPAVTDQPADDRDRRNAVPPRAEPPPADAEAISSPPPWDLLSPLVAGSVVAHDWRLVGLGPVQGAPGVATPQHP